MIQEYFAAQHFAENPEPDLAKQEWQIEYVSPSLTEKLKELSDFDPLPPLDATGWEETLAMASECRNPPIRL